MATTARRRVVVTGMGAVCALGPTLPQAWAASLAGRGGIALHTQPVSEHGPPSAPFPLALAADGWADAVDARLGRQVVGGLDPFAGMALAAALEAVDAAGLGDHPVLSERTAVVFGHGQGGLVTLEASYERFFGLKSPRLHPATVPKVMLSAGVSAIAMALGVHGPVFATSSACASSAHAIAQGAALIADGEADVALVGGSEAIATPGSLRSWEAIRAMSTTTCRPFSIDRDGMVLGEGGAALTLEALDHAQARGARIWGELLGSGMSSDAFHITQPSAAGAARAIRGACERAGVLDRDDLLISAHGTGTPLNDVSESQALGEVFGERATRLPVIATKSAHGHLIGGSAALQTVLGLTALAERIAPPVLNFTAPDPACPLDVVIGGPRPIAAEILLQNAFAFGGLNVCLVFGSTLAS
jgi:nodulation protein E